MQKLIVFVALVACSFAAPVENIPETFATPRLARPSPINPDIPSDPKPEEKVILISTEKPLDNEQPVITPLGPYALPSPPKQLTKREDKQPSKPVGKDSSSSSSSEENSSEEDKKPSTVLKPISVTSGPEKLPTQSSEAAVDHSTAIPSTTATYRKPYSPLIHQHNEHLFKPTTEAAAPPALASSPELKHPAVVPAVASNEHINDKRDIPVESQQKVESEAAKPASTEEAKKDEENGHASHPAIISRPIPVAELFAKKPSTE